MRRLFAWLLDTGPVVVLALIAGAGSFTHIRDTAEQHGQSGPMAWAVAVCIDLTCVMAARERQRDKKTGRTRSGPVSWPTVVLVAGIVLSLAANLAQAEPSVWGRLTAATPAGAFLVAVSMLERRANAPRPAPDSSPAPSPVSAPAVPPDTASSAPATIPAERPQPIPPVPEPSGVLAPDLVDFARRTAAEHHARTGKPITRDVLRARLGVSPRLASDLLRHLDTAPHTA